MRDISIVIIILVVVILIISSCSGKNVFLFSIRSHRSYVTTNPSPEEERFNMIFVDEMDAEAIQPSFIKTVAQSFEETNEHKLAVVKMQVYIMYNFIFFILILLGVWSPLIFVLTTRFRPIFFGEVGYA